MKIYNVFTALCLYWLLTIPAGAQQVKIEAGNLVAPVSRFLYLESGLRSDEATWLFPLNLTREAIQEAMKGTSMSHIKDTHFSVGDLIEHDLNGDGVQEILVTIGSSGSGGTEYAVLEQKKTKWKLIGWIQGGFNIEPHYGKVGEHARIETWSRHGGAIYHKIWKVKNGFYRVIDSIEWPKEFTLGVPPFDPLARAARENSFSPERPSTKDFMRNCQRVCAVLGVKRPVQAQPETKE